MAKNGAPALLALAALSFVTAAPLTAAAQRAMPAGAFTDMIGVNSHMDWQSAGSAYASIATVRSALTYLGVRHVRDATPYPGWTLPIYQQLAATGIRFIFPISSTEFNRTGSFAADLDRIDALERSNPGSVAAVEGLNEINTWVVTHNGRSTGNDLAVARDVQALLHRQTKSYPALRKVPVVSLTFGGITSQQASVVGDLSPYADYGAWHVYFGNGDQPSANILSGVASAKTITPGRPVQITETNYYTAVDAMEWGGGGVTETVQAKLVLNLLFVAAKAGVARTYLYELLDDNVDLGKATTVEGSFGLFRGDGTPKLAATAIRSLMTVLRDTAANAGSIPTESLNYSLSGLPRTGNTLLMQKSDGSFQLAIWAEPDIWDETTRTAIPAPVVPVSLTLRHPAASMRVYDPVTGTEPLATVRNTRTISVVISDRPVIVEVSGFPQRKRRDGR